MEYETNELGMGALADDGGEGLMDNGAVVRPATAATTSPIREDKSTNNIYILTRPKQDFRASNRTRPKMKELIFSFTVSNAPTLRLENTLASLAQPTGQLILH